MLVHRARDGDNAGPHFLAANQCLVPPSGYVVRIYARTDTESGIHKAPAKEVLIRDNCEVGRGTRHWGTRSIPIDPQLHYVNLRRLLLFIEESLNKATQWVIFEPNDARLWASTPETIISSLLLACRSGALQGEARAEASFVKCDKTPMTRADMDAGRLVCTIGIAPVKPAEFVIFRFQQ